MSVLKIKVDGVWKDIPAIVGEAAGFGEVTATVDANHGTPSVTVTTSGEDTAKNFAFEFKNLQPAPYDDSVIQARMDSFTNLAEGSTTGDAELIDGRVGADGVTYTNIGDAIRGQVTDLKADLGNFKYSQTKTARLMELSIPVSSGEIIYFKPLKWTGDSFTNIDLYGNNNGTYTRIGRVNAINEETFISVTANYNALRVAVSTASAPSTAQTLEVILVSLTSMDSISQYALQNKYEDGYKIMGNLSFSSSNLTSPYNDLNTFPSNRIASYVGSAAALTSNAPVKSWFTIISYNYNISNASNQNACVQVLTEVNTGVRYSRVKTSSWTEWISDTLPIYVNKSGWHSSYKAYTTFKAGIEAAVACGNCKLYIDDGEYDILDEFGSAWLEAYDQSKACGCLIGNGVEVEFSNNAKLIANYVGNNDLIKQYFSPLNVIGTFKLINANIEVANVRYCVHEDITTIATAPSVYNAEYKNCRMKHNGNNLSGWTSNFCLGCGASPNGRTIIEGGHYIANNNRHTPIFWHNSGTSSPASYVKIDSVILGENDHFHLRRGAANGNTVIMEITNCLMGADITYADGAPDKFDLTVWNNVLRS